jgi:hypothetical protein
MKPDDKFGMYCFAGESVYRNTPVKETIEITLILIHKLKKLTNPVSDRPQTKIFAQSAGSSISFSFLD